MLFEDKKKTNCFSEHRIALAICAHKQYISQVSNFLQL